MNTEFPIDPRKALESSLTALLLGELPEEQARFLRQAIATDPELAKMFNTLKKTIELVREVQSDSTAEPVAQTESSKLSVERRAELFRHFKTVRPVAFQQPLRRRSNWLLPVAASGAVLLLVAGLVVPALSRNKARSMASRDAANVRRLAERNELIPLPGTRSGSVTRLLVENGNSERHFPQSLTVGGVAAPAEEAKPPQSQSSIVLPVEPKPEALTLSAGNAGANNPNLDFYFAPPLAAARPASQAQTQSFDGTFQTFGVATPSLAGALQRQPVLGDQPELGELFLSQLKDDKAGSIVVTTNALPPEPWAVSAGLRGYYSGGGFGGYSTISPASSTQAFGTITIAGVGEVPVLKEPKTEDAEKLHFDKQTGKALAESVIPPSGESRLRETLRNSGDNASDNSFSVLPTPALPAVEAESSQTLAGAKDLALDQTKQKTEKETLARKMARADSLQDPLNKKTAGRAKVAELQFGDRQVDGRDAALAPKPVAAPAVPQPEVQTQSNLFSTFSLNVSDVSFKLAAASLEKGVLPEPASIRSEEFINAFDYRDPEPAAGAPIAFAFERAQFPFAQNRDLLRFSIKTAAVGRQNGRPLNLVLLLDNSGSMERADRVRIIHEALRVLATQLQAQDTFSVVTFARTARLWVDGVAGDQAGRIADQLSSLTPEGGTNLEQAMNLAYQTALRHYATIGINRVVLLTDGAANLGDTNPSTLKQKVETNRKQGIALDCFGVGWEGYNDDLLEELTRNGDGRYGFINTPEEAASGFATQLAGALQVAASDVKVQVEFNPNRVTSYRQIGYARHQLTKEQFRDNSVDAAEIGAAEAGNAVFVIESNPGGEGPLATVRVRYKLPGTTDYREQEWAVPFGGTAAPLDQAGPAMRLAATASAFSEWLAQSPFANEVTPDRLLGFLSGVPATYGVDPRPQKLEWMVRQAKVISGK